MSNNAETFLVKTGTEAWVWKTESKPKFSQVPVESPFESPNRSARNKPAPLYRSNSYDRKGSTMLDGGTNI